MRVGSTVSRVCWTPGSSICSTGEGKVALSFLFVENPAQAAAVREGKVALSPVEHWFKQLQYKQGWIVPSHQLNTGSSSY